MKNIKLICIDFQKEFTLKEGKWFRPPRKSINFIKNTLVPFLRKNNLNIAEIISDYRPPRPRYEGYGCYPGKPGFESEIPKDIKLKAQWIKCMNSPLWVRKNIGNPNKNPGIPYQDPKAFSKWLKITIGKPNELDYVVLFGLTIDCCVLCTAQELTWRGYKIKILKEATDTSRSTNEDKKRVISSRPLLQWASIISWSELKKDLLE